MDVEKITIEHKNYTNSNNIRDALLNQLPYELRKRWGGKPIDDIQKVINERRELGFETILGYHCSNNNLSVGDFIKPGDDNMVHYATDIKNLYGNKKGKYLYIVEGSNQDKDSDKGLSWKTSFSRLKIIDKIKLTHENVDKIGANFVGY